MNLVGGHFRLSMKSIEVKDYKNVPGFDATSQIQPLVWSCHKSPAVQKRLLQNNFSILGCHKRDRPSFTVTHFDRRALLSQK